MSSENVEAPFNAATKFWGCPELVEKLLTFLDVQSTLNLARVHPLTIAILKAGPTWRKLVKRTCRVNDTDDWAAFEEQRIEVQHLVEISSLMGNPKPLILDLLDVIAERFPPVRRMWMSEKDVEVIQVSCPRHNTHSVSLLGFRLLELVEGRVGFPDALQPIEKAKVTTCFSSLLAALSSRVSRQQLLIELDLEKLYCASLNDADAILTLMQNCSSVNWRNRSILIVRRGAELGAEGWATLAEAVCLHPGFSDVCANRDEMLAADRGDLRAIWDALGGGVGAGTWFVRDRDWHIVTVGKEESWAALEHVLDVCYEAFREMALASDEEEEEDDSDEEEDEDDDNEEEEEED